MSERPIGNEPNVGGQEAGDAEAGPGSADGAPLEPSGAGQGETEREPAERGPDLGRRSFFRAFASDIVAAAVQVVGTATALQRSTTEAAGAILNPKSEAALRSEHAASLARPMFRTAFRWEPDRLVLVDQRRLPEAVVEYECRVASDVAQAIRELVVVGGPVVGQVGAVALALTADRMHASQPYARRATLVGSANALINARPSSLFLRVAVARMLARWRAIGELDEDGGAIAAALRGEAEAIVSEATAAHGRIAELAADELRRLAIARDGGRPDPSATEAAAASASATAAGATGTRRLRVVTLGTSGVLAGGQFGTALSALVSAAQAGLELQVTVAETRPGLEGARVTAWELAQAGVPHALVVDAALGAVVSNGADAVLIGGERVAANGDLAAVTGTYPLAALAARHAVPVIACMPLASFDDAAATGAELTLEDRPMQEVVRFADRPLTRIETLALNPLLDVTPAGLIGLFVTEAGVLRPPFERSIAELSTAARDARGPGTSTVTGGAPVVGTAVPPSPTQSAGPAAD